MEKIVYLAAKIFAGKDWHKLSKDEQELVAELEKLGHLIPNNPANGFAGSVPPQNT